MPVRPTGSGDDPHHRDSLMPSLLRVEPLEDRTVPATAFTLTAAGLVSFDTSTPAATNAAVPITGVTAGETLVGLDIRPQNGMLYGLGVNATADTATLYAISARTGTATAVGPASQIQFTTDGTTVVNLPDPAPIVYDPDYHPPA